MTLKVLTWNTLFAGRDGGNAARAQKQISVINQLQPDVFLMQEATGFDAAGGALLYNLEQQIGMRGFLAVAPRTGQHVAVFIRERLRPIAFETDSVHFHHAAAALTVELPGTGSPATFIATHLCPNAPWVRRSEIAYHAVRAAPDRLTLLAGDFNSASPHDAEPLGFDALPLHYRARYLAEDGRAADRTVLASLESAGWIDVGHALGGTNVPTVPASGFPDTEFATMRCDYVLASRVLAEHAATYEVIRTPETDTASDHYPLLTTFERLS